MAHITALLIVLTLTGQPVAYALCTTWCDLQSDTETCDEAIAPPTSTSISVTRSSCAVLVTTSPFLRDEGRTALHALPATSGHAFTPALTVVAFGTANGAGHSTTAGRPQPILVLRV